MPGWPERGFTRHAIIALMYHHDAGRITQLMNLRNLAPRILSSAEGQRTQMPLTEGALRRISGILDWREQIRQFEELCEMGSGGKARNHVRDRFEPDLFREHGPSRRWT